MNWNTISLSDVVKVAREIADLHENSYTPRPEISIGWGFYKVSWTQAQEQTFKRYGITCTRLQGFLSTVAYIGELTEVR
jgi:hypothetical protein